MADTTDTLDLTGLRSGAQAASSELANLQTSVPGMLRDLKSSLTSIYAKDNPLIQARDEALSRFLSGGDVARAELLPQNLPQVAGSPLTLSPTQQNAIVSSRQAANLAPLLGLNQAVVAGYGNIGDIVSGAADIYQAQIGAAKTKLDTALSLYQQGIAEYNAATARQEADRKAQTGEIDPTVAALLQAILQGQQQPTDTRPPIETFDEPDTVQTITIPGQGTIQPYTPVPISGPPGRFNIFAQLGAIPELIFGRRPPTSTSPATSFNLLGQQSVGPFKQ